MATTVENRIGSEAKVLQSYLGGKWQAGAEGGAALVNPTTGETVARASSKGLDLKAALDYSRKVGGAELRKLSTPCKDSKAISQVATISANADEDGTVHFFDDIYSYDKELEAALAQPRPYPRDPVKINPKLTPGETE